MADTFTMHHPHGGQAQTTRRAYEQIWKDKGWRKRPPPHDRNAASQRDVGQDTPVEGTDQENI